MFNLKYNLLLGLLIFLIGCSQSQTENQTENQAETKPQAQADTTAVETAQSDVVYQDPNGNVLTLTEIRKFAGGLSWEAMQGIEITEKVQDVHRAGRRYAQEGEHDKALYAFTNAAQAVPNWPLPVHDMANIFLLEENFDRALEYYRKVDEMAPRGYFATKTAIHYLQKEQKGKCPRGTYLKYINAGWEADSTRKVQMLDDILQECPEFAPAWKEKVFLSDSDEEGLRYIDQGLASNPDPETRGILLINRAMILARQGDVETAVAILGDLAVSPDTTLENEYLARAALKQMFAPQANEAGGEDK